MKNTLVVDGLEHVRVFVPHFSGYSKKVQNAIIAWVRKLARNHPTLCDVWVERVIGQQSDKPRVYGSFSYR